MKHSSWFCRFLGTFVALTLAVAVHAAEPLEVRGQWQQGGTLFGEVPRGSVVKINDRSVRVSPEGQFVFGIGRDDSEPVKIAVTIPTGQTYEKIYPVAKREYNIQRIEGVAQKHVTPPQEVLDRIADENARVREARLVDDPRTDFTQPFIWPLVGPITGVYGSQRVYNGVPKSPHYGVDIAAPVGATVVAPAAGLVTLAEPNLYFSGGTLIVDHGHGFSSTFIHLSKILVQKGERVTQGQPVAEVGATGRVTGPHLDWRLNWFDVRMDPQLLMQDIPMPAAAPKKTKVQEDPA